MVCGREMRTHKSSLRTMKRNVAIASPRNPTAMTGMVYGLLGRQVSRQNACALTATRHPAWKEYQKQRHLT